MGRKRDGIRERSGVMSVRVTTPIGRREITIGKVDIQSARSVANNIRRLAEFENINMPLDPRLVEWWSGTGQDLRARVRRAGLMGAQIDNVTFDDALNRWLARRKSISRQIDKMIRTADAAWPREKPLRSFGAEDGLAFRKVLETQGWSESTVNRICRSAKGVFKLAIHDGVRIENPFADIATGDVINRDRQTFVEPEWIARMMKKANHNWKARIMAGRWLGLRAPSELNALRIRHFNLERRTVTIPRCKTAERVVPLFPEIYDFIVWYVRTVHGCKGNHRFVTVIESNSNWRRDIKSIQRRAGVTPWPKPWNNMRSTRQTELVDAGFPEHVVCAWLGNSPTVGRSNYLQVTAEHMARATGLA